MADTKLFVVHKRTKAGKEMRLIIIFFSFTVECVDLLREKKRVKEWQKLDVWEVGSTSSEVVSKQKVSNRHTQKYCE